MGGVRGRRRRRLQEDYERTEMFLWLREEEGKQKGRRGERQLSNNNPTEPANLHDIPKKLPFLRLCLPRFFPSSINLTNDQIYSLYER